MASLYEAGWRQGSIVAADLPLDAIVLGARSGQPERCEGEHGLWVVASQDCDLDQSDTDDGTPCRPPRSMSTKATRSLSIDS